MQRLHEDDLVGHFLEQEDWKVVSFPAIVERDEEQVIDRPFATRRVTRRVGECVPHSIPRASGTLAHMPDRFDQIVQSAIRPTSYLN